MAKGDGSVTEVKTKEGNSYRPKKWRVCVSFGFDPITKKRDQVTRTVTGTKADAQRVRDAIKRDRSEGIAANGYKMTFADFANSWAESRKANGELQERTYEGDSRAIAMLAPYIGPMKLSNITPAIIERTYTAIKNSKPGRKGDTLSGTTMHGIHQKLNQIMNDAEYKGLILRNPCARVKAPRIDVPDRKALSAYDFAMFTEYTARECERVIAAFNAKEVRQEQRGNAKGRTAVRGIADISRLTAVRLGIASGMRIGEILGLRWRDVDFNVEALTVHQALTNSGNVKRPKNNRARTIALDRETMQHLATVKFLQCAAFKTIGINQTGETPVCCSDVGGYYGIANFEHWFRRFRVRAGFPDLRFHELRHTQATQLIANGMDVKTVQERLGHSNASTTLNFYAHATEEKDREAAALIHSIANGAKETPIIAFKTA